MEIDPRGPRVSALITTVVPPAADYVDYID